MQTFKRMGIYWSKLAFIFLLSFSSNAAEFSFLPNTNDVVQGEKGIWKTYWQGLGNDQASASQLPRACLVVVHALNAAKNRNFSLFCSYFKKFGTNSMPQIKILYDELSLRSQQYVYMIAQEAVLTNINNSYSAISIAPVALRDAGQSFGDLSQLKAHVIFAQKAENVWELSADIFDKKVEETLSNRASLFLYKTHKFTKEENDKENKKFEASVLEDMRKKGMPPEMIVSKKETFQIMDAAVQINNWADWTNYYKAIVLNPPVTFCMRDPTSVNFSNPVSACRSYLRALFVGDGKTLLKYADKSGINWLKYSLKVNENTTNISYHISPKILTHVTILLTASTSVDGEDYVMVFWRSQNENNPTNGPIALQRTFFLHKQDEYLLTENLNDSTLAAILPLARANGADLLRYADFYRKMQRSDFPTNFYKIEQ